MRIMSPQLDIVTFLASALSESSDINKWYEHLEFYRKCILKELVKLDSSNETLQSVIDKDEFKFVFHMCVIERLLNKLSSMLIINEFVPSNNVWHGARNTLRFIKSFSDELTFLQN